MASRAHCLSYVHIHPLAKPAAHPQFPEILAKSEMPTIVTGENLKGLNNIIATIIILKQI